MSGDVIAIIVMIVIYSCKCFSAKDAKVHP